mgnify:CR=1 FL=1
MDDNLIPPEQSFEPNGYALPKETSFSIYKEINDYKTTEFLLSNDRLIEQLKQYLLGIAWIETKKGGEYRRVAMPVMNETGAFRFLKWVDTYLAKEVFLSNFDKRETIPIVKQLATEVTCHLIEHYKEYGMKPENISPVVNIVVDLSNVGLRRAVGEGERNFLRGQVQVREVIQEKPQEKKSFLSRIFNRGW